MSLQSSFDSINDSANCFFSAVGARFFIFLMIDKTAKHEDAVLLCDLSTLSFLVPTYVKFEGLYSFKNFTIGFNHGRLVIQLLLS